MTETNSWFPKRAPHPLEIDEIHLWRAFLDCEETLLTKFETTLAPDELARANRFFSPLDRAHFISTRGILRELLSRYANCPARDLAFDYSAHGKPSLKVQDGTRPPQFNVSHSHGLAMFAFAMRSPVGVDVEIVRTNIACDEIAQRYFSRQEAAELRAAPRQLQAEAFFLCWTRKEAYVKARGEGLQIPLDSFNVSLLPGTPPRLESVDSSQWCLHSFRPHERYVGALVTSRKQCQVRYWDWVPTSSAGCPNEAQ